MHLSYWCSLHDETWQSLEGRRIVENAKNIRKTFNADIIQNSGKLMKSGIHLRSHPC